MKREVEERKEEELCKTGERHVLRFRKQKDSQEIFKNIQICKW